MRTRPASPRSGGGKRGLLRSRRGVHVDAARGHDRLGQFVECAGVRSWPEMLAGGKWHLACRDGSPASSHLPHGGDDSEPDAAPSLLPAGGEAEAAGGNDAAEAPAAT